ncbi:MAG TPA: hypothetical protein VMQ51_06685 [Candidatus Binatia bacterium]|nr:hypothetical protein [Candidatus Binatia bacterium]
MIMLARRVPLALALAALLLFGRSEAALASARASWGPAFDDPTTVDLADLCGLVAEAISLNDPMNEVCRSLQLALRPIGEVPVASMSAADDYAPRAHRPRAPPAA